MPAPLVYVCADPKDHDLVSELREVLTPLADQEHLIRLADAAATPAGTPDEDPLALAQIFIPLISVDFLASELTNQLLPRALERHEAGQLRVLPVIARPCFWQKYLGKLPVFPDRSRPLRWWPQRQEAWQDVLRGLRQMLASTPTAQETSGASPDPAHPPLPARPPAPQPGPRFCWLHLSDLHFGHGDAGHGWDQQLVLDALRRDITTRLQEDLPRPQAILVTGDIAFSGGDRLRPEHPESREYADAGEYLRSLAQIVGIAPDRIFLVPGNHDVQWSADKDNQTRRLLRMLREGLEPLDDALLRPDDLDLLASRQARYLDFAAAFAPACLDPAPAPASKRLWWSCSLPVHPDLQIRLIGLNTALLSAGDGDQGKLRLGKGPLAQTLLPAPQAQELTIVLSHHPIGHAWLEAAEDKEAWKWLRRHAHLYLCGHVHEADSEQRRTGGGAEMVQIVAGAAHAEQHGEQEHTYSLAAISRREDGSLWVRHWPRRLSGRDKIFRTHADIVPDRTDHAEHCISSASALG